MKDDRVYLEQIVDCTDSIREFVRDMDNAAFLKDRKTQSAVIMQLALIGELAKRISAPVKSSIAVPWKQIAGFRDRAIHDYYQIDLQVAWDTIAQDLEPLAREIREYLVRYPGLPQ
jgi:uncharacterized protein with HEPN domain